MSLNKSIEVTCCEPQFTFIKLESDLPIKVYSCLNCLSEWTTCHCKKTCKLMYGDSGTKYLTCADNKCTFIIIRCSKCNKLCRVERAKTKDNPGRLFWICRNNLNHDDSFFGGWIDLAVRKYIGIENIYTPDFLCLISEYTEYSQFKKIIADLISREKVTLSDIHNELIRKNYLHLNVENLIREIRYMERDMEVDSNAYSPKINTRTSLNQEKQQMSVIDLTIDDETDSTLDNDIDLNQNFNHSPKINISGSSLTLERESSEISTKEKQNRVVDDLTHDLSTDSIQKVNMTHIGSNNTLDEILNTIKSLKISIDKIGEDSNNIKDYIMKKIDDNEKRTNNLEERAGSLEESTRNLEERTDNLEERTDSLVEITSKFEKRLFNLESYIESRKRKTNVINDDNDKNNIYKGRLRKRIKK